MLFYAEAWRPILWLRVGTDGSIYIGVLLGAPTVGVLGSTAIMNGKATIRFSEGEKLQGQTLPSSTRVSFKTSGEIHLGNVALEGYPLVGLNKTVRLCRAQFAHPSSYRPPAKRNANDYDIKIVDYPVDDARPMRAEIFVSPLRPDEPSRRHPMSVSMKYQNDFFLGFRGLGPTPDFVLQISIGHGIEGRWPELPWIAVTSNTRPS